MQKSGLSRVSSRVGFYISIWNYWHRLIELYIYQLGTHEY